MKRRRGEEEKFSPIDKLKGRKVAVYSRKSKFTGKGASVENQVRDCHDYIRLHVGDMPEGEILKFEDEGYSGKNIDRPRFKAMMDACKRGEIGMIVCYRLDRFSRNTLDFLNISKELAEWNVSFVSINDHFDTTTSTGKAMMSMVAVFAELERETIQERICDNLLALAETGRWLGGQCPTGYKSEEVKTSDKRKLYKLILVPKEAELIRLIFRTFMETNSVVATDTYLLQRGIKTKNGKSFSRHTIKAILENPVYMVADRDAWNYFARLEVEVFSPEEAFNGQHGMMVYNKTSQTKGKGHEYQEMDEWVIAVGAHPGIISGADWVKVQGMLHQNKSKSYHKTKSHHALLSGLLYCGDCGAYMRPKQSQRTNEKGELIFAYLCEQKERSKGKCCDMPRPNGNTLDDFVCEKVKLLANNPQLFEQKLQHYQQSIADHSGEYADEVDSLIEQIAEVSKQIENLVMAVANGDPQGYMQQQIEKLHQQKSELKQRVEEIKSITRAYLYPEDEIAILVDGLTSFARTFDNMTVEEKRQALRRFIQRLEYYRADGEKEDNVKFYFFGFEDFDAPDGPDDPNGGGEGEPQGGGSK